jgi:uncharacterized membrane protein YhaH (DUF805 family)/frataxin-like iron-binding protein CyaY
METVKGLYQKLQSIYSEFISGMWLVRIVNQMITTSGNIAESAFLLATLWILINIAGHTVISWVVDKHTAVLIDNLCSIAFAALPELLFLTTLKTCIKHCLTVFRYRDNKVALTWAILYGIPAILFGIITVYVLSVASTDGIEKAITLGSNWLMIRYLSGLFYAVIHSIDVSFAKPHFARMLVEKDQLIDQISTDKDTEISKLNRQMEDLKTQFESEKTDLIQSFNLQISDFTLKISELNATLISEKQKSKKLAEVASEASLQGLNHWSKTVNDWIENAGSTIDLEEIILQTGFTKKRIMSANLKATARNKEKFYKDSVIEFLRKNKPNRSSNYVEIVEESNGNGHFHTEEIEVLSLPLLATMSED